MQIDEAVLDARAAQRLSGPQPDLAGQPRLELLDVVALEIRAADDRPVMLRQPGAELAEVVLDVAHRRRPETQGQLGTSSRNILSYSR
jgi:hypothetical protein